MACCQTLIWRVRKMERGREKGSKQKWGDEIGKCDKHRMPLRKVAFLYFWRIFIVPDNRFHYDILMIHIICIDSIHP